MPEHLRALIVVLVLALTVLAVGRPHAAAQAMAAADFDRRRKLWLAIVLMAFLAHNFWLFMVATAALLLVAAPREPNRLALFFFLMFAIPSYSAPIPALGLANQLFTLSYLRLLALIVLLPAFFALVQAPAEEKLPANLADKTLAAYLLLSLGLQFTVDSATNTMRYGFYAFLDVVLPYYVASRAMRHPAQFREALMSLVVAAMVVAAIGAFEYGKKWLLFSSLDEALGVDWNYGAYLGRAESLRALATTGQPIALGYVAGVAAGIFLYLRAAVPSRLGWGLGLLLLVAGLLAPVSRGPWLAAAAAFTVFLASGRQPLANLLRLTLVAGIVIPLVIASPIGDRVIEHLPFVGSVDAENITYRQRLLEMSLAIIQRNPWFGTFDFLQYLEELRQGQGIIDVVNTYLGITLTTGLVGLGLFLSFFGVILGRLWLGLRRLPAEAEEVHLLGRSLLATLVFILICIFTVSSITVIPVLYWALGGLGLAYVHLLEREYAPRPASLSTLRPVDLRA